MTSQPFAAIATTTKLSEFVVVCMGGLVESDLVTMIERSDSNGDHLARFRSQRIYPSYYSLIDL